jgi:uncharacterized protein (UPF0332 family)
VRKELGRALRRAYDLRQKGDYATGFMVSGSEAKKILEETTEFISEITKHLDNN